MNVRNMYRNMRGMQFHGMQANFVLFLVRLGLVVFIGWQGLLQIQHNPIIAIAMLLLAGMLLLGILQPIAAIGVVVVLALPIIAAGYAAITPEIVFAGLVAAALFFQPRGH